MAAIFREVWLADAPRTKGILKCTEHGAKWVSTAAGRSIAVPKDQIKNIEFYSTDKVYQLKMNLVDKKKAPVRFQGLSRGHTKQAENFAKKIGKSFSERKVCLKGFNWGKFKLKQSEVQFRSENDEIMTTIPYELINNSAVQGKNEVGFEFKPPSDARADSETLTEMRIFIPDEEVDGSNPNEGENAKEFHRLLLIKAGLSLNETDTIAKFDNITFKTPRGKYLIEFFPTLFRLRGPTYSYNVKYQNIKKLFLFHQPNNHHALLISLSPAFRQGQTLYHHLIMDFEEDGMCESKLNITDEQIKSDYAGRDGK